MNYNFCITVAICSVLCISSAPGLVAKPWGQCVIQAATSIDTALKASGQASGPHVIPTVLNNTLLQCFANMVNDPMGRAPVNASQDIIQTANVSGHLLHVLTPPYRFLWALQCQSVSLPLLHQNLLQFDRLAASEIPHVMLACIQAGRAGVEDPLAPNVDAAFMDMRSVAELGVANSTYCLEYSRELEGSQQWMDVMPAVRDHLVRYDRQTVAVPMSGDVLLMYYRQDLLQAAGAKVPGTWEEVVEVAGRVNGTDLDGDGQVEYGVCMDLWEGCHLSTWIEAIAAPYLQTKGVHQGAWFDPATMKLLLGAPVFQEVMGVLQRLVPLMPPCSTRGNQGPCTPHNHNFLRGECALTIGWSSFFKVLMKSPSSKVKGVFRVAPLPGSSRVLDRGRRRLVDCSRTLCPRAQLGSDGRLVNRPTYAPAYIFSPTVQCWQSQQQQEEEEEQQDKAGELVKWMSSSNATHHLVLDASLEPAPFRRSHLELRQWVGSGYEVEGTQGYLQVLERVLGGNDIVMEMRVPCGNTTSALLGSLTLYVMSGRMSAEEAGERLVNGTDECIRRRGGSEVLGELYRKSLNARQWKKAPAPHLGIGIILPAVLVPCILMLFMLLVMGFGLVYFKRETERLGRAFAPGVSPDSTMVVTDIQGSTSLWELLPAKVMDTSVKEHQQVIRRLLQKHYGYESATEGDSFILAFHSAQDAVQFALDVQEALLLRADWPPELLQTELCRPQWVRHVKAPLDPLDATIDFPSREWRSCHPLPTHPDHVQPPYSRSPLSLRRFSAALLWAVRHLRGFRREGGQAAWPSHLQMTALQSEPHREGGMVWEEVGEGDHLRGYQEGCVSFRTACQLSWEATEEGMEGAVLVFRGLRVRVGAHSGICSPEQLLVNSADSRVHYSGVFAQVAKAVSDAAHGGMVTLSGCTAQRLKREELPECCLMIHCGEHQLPDCNSIMLWQAVRHGLRGRLAFLPPVRSLSQVGAGVFEAPLGRVTVASMSVQGCSGHHSWTPSMAAHSMHMFHEVTAHHINRFRAYMIESEGNCVRAAFSSALDAVLWALDVQALMIHIPSAAQRASRGSVWEEGASEDSCTLALAVHVKGGIDTSDVTACVDRCSGRLKYRGSAVGRACKISNVAGTEQILCSEETAAEVVQEEGERGEQDVQLRGVGVVKLKGLHRNVPLYSCVYGHLLHSRVNILRCCCCVCVYYFMVIRYPNVVELFMLIIFSKIIS